MTVDAPRTPGRAAFAFIFVTVLLDMLALGIVLPVLPKLIKAFMGGDTAGASSIVGWFGAAWALMQFIFQPVLGALSDRFGRRPVVILSNWGLGLDYIFMALAPNLWFLFVGRLISGITAASFAAASAYIADVSPPEKRAQRFGLLGAAFGLGFVIGPAVGGVLGDIGLRLPFWGAAAVSLANGCYGLFVLPESLSRDRRAPFAWRQANPIGSLRFLRSSAPVFRLSITVFLLRLSQGALHSIFDYRFGWDAKMVGVSLAVVGVAQMIVSGALVRPVIARVGERGALLLGLLCGATGFLIYGLAWNGTIFLCAIPFSALWGLAPPAIQSQATRLVGPREQGQLQGAQSSLASVADMLGPLVFTNIFAAVVIAQGAFHILGAPFFVGGLIVLAALGVSWKATRPILALAE
jgi:DHA1 family tetracycline resistance protein-like MFS transporter